MTGGTGRHTIYAPDKTKGVYALIESLFNMPDAAEDDLYMPMIQINQYENDKLMKAVAKNANDLMFQPAQTGDPGLWGTPVDMTFGSAPSDDDTEAYLKQDGSPGLPPNRYWPDINSPGKKFLQGGFNEFKKLDINVIKTANGAPQMIPGPNNGLRDINEYSKSISDANKLGMAGKMGKSF